MGKFCQLSPELWPLIDVKNLFPLTLPFLYPATLNSAGYYVIPSVQKFAFECPSVRQRFVSALYLEHFLTDFLQTLSKS